LSVCVCRFLRNSLKFGNLHPVITYTVRKFSLSCTMLSDLNMVIYFISATNCESKRGDFTLNAQSHWLKPVSDNVILKITFLPLSEISSSVAPISTKLSNLVPSYFMKTFTEGFVNILFLISITFYLKKTWQNIFLRLLTVYFVLKDNKRRYP